MGGKIQAGALALATVVLADPSLAGGGGFHAGFRPPGGYAAPGGFRGGGSGWRGGGFRPMPPVAGVIHERPGGRPFYSAFGHTNTSYGLDGGFRAGYRGYPGVRGGLRYGGTIGPGYGHLATGFRSYGGQRYGRWRFGGDRRFAGSRYGRFYGGFGAFGGYGGYAGGYGGSGGSGVYYDASGGTAGAGGYGTPGSYGSYGTQAGAGGAYLSEPPLAATRTEAPLAPSPYGDDGGYYSPERSGIEPHIITVDRSAHGGCGCRSGGGAYPAIYRYGVGTAY